MKKKKINYETLTREEAEKMAKLIRTFTKEIVGKEYEYLIDKVTKNYADNILFKAISEKIIKAREKRNLTIKEISKILKIPQYKIRYIEESNLTEIEIKFFEKYLHFLNLEIDYNKWTKKHKDIIEKYNLPDKLGSD